MSKGKSFTSSEEDQNFDVDIPMHDAMLDGLLQPLSQDMEEVDLNAAFLGPKAENYMAVEKMLLEVFRDHVYWRRNFHPEDVPVISPEAQNTRSYRNFMAKFERELFMLLGKLKSDVPWFSPRYIGHMNADTALPALVAYVATMLYNPNNVAWEGSPVTTLLEVEVGRELAKMLGYGGQSKDDLSHTWGHITSGGTIANMEALWVAKAVKYLPVAVRFACQKLQLEEVVGSVENGKLVTEMSAWELVNLSPGEALDLKDRYLQAYISLKSDIDAEEAIEIALDVLKSFEILTLGDHAFYSLLPDDDKLNAPVMVAPQTRHYSWVKAPGALGIGSGQVLRVPVDCYYRMDMQIMRSMLEEALLEKRPVIMVVGVAGTTEEGAVDPIDAMVHLREEMAGKGLGFFLHCDAAYGGYVAACFRRSSGELRSLEEMQLAYSQWPTEEVYKSYAAMGQVDSVTIDPHKLGYAPYPAGAIVFRDGRSKSLVAQEASYVFDTRADEGAGIAVSNIGQYILEGSKPGAAAASVFLSHKVIPPDERGYGKLIGKTAANCREFYERMNAFGEFVKDDFIVKPLVIPDTNILNYVFNIVGNNRLDVMNQFSEKLYRQLSIAPSSPVQTRRFIVSHTRFECEEYNPDVIQALLTELGIAEKYLVDIGELKQIRKTGKIGYDNGIVVFRTTLMSPFISQEAHDSKDYFDLFFEELTRLLQTSSKSWWKMMLPV